MDHSTNLTCPELLSDHVLRTVLGDRCIEAPDLKAMDRSKLIELFIRVALPLPQRHYCEERPLGKRMNDLRLSRSITIDENNHLSTADTTNSEKRKIIVNESSSGVLNGKLISPIDNWMPQQKKIRMSNSKCSEIEEKTHRNYEQEIHSLSPPNKRQKITWP